jgi:transcriptional regulator with XRE-family HTH domain
MCCWRNAERRKRSVHAPECGGQRRNIMRAIRKLQVKKLRKQKGMSQSQLAKALGVTKEAVSLWERGRVPTDEMQQHLCDYFGVSFGELWGLEKGQEMPELDTSEFIPSQDFTYLWSALIAACSMVCKLQGEGNPYELMTKLIKQSTAKLSVEAAQQGVAIAEIMEAFHAEEEKEAAKEQEASNAGK